MITIWPRRNYADFAFKEGCICNHPKNRPAWLRRMPKPAGVIGYSIDQVECFLWAWSIRTRFKDKVYCFTATDTEQLFEKLEHGSPLFMLPYGGWMSQTELMKGIREKADGKGIVTISVPMNIARGEPWPDEDSLCISTRLEIAKKSL